ncbi:diphosphomevalonate decarboxylase [Dictyocaulus viviparus]|uniref:Diphosphomevalonate decarboxylase n=1 Tax=Dictyocaulus viviparus TaxID=29172 RepID=A0A0D8Y0X9_DICVI|nr:diphosphomevalonate decarboxylase [Dictyocaulus viviparus]
MSTVATQRNVEVEVPVNIALIKYWGKKDEDHIIPVNNSVSLNIDELFARTYVQCSYYDSMDSVSINNVTVDLTRNPRFLRCFDDYKASDMFAELCTFVQYARQLIQGHAMLYDSAGIVSKPQLSFQVSSTTNFPVGAGLASSAAGFAAIAFGIGKMFDLTMNEVSSLARIGSGSACRSVFGGLVEWEAGSEPSGADSFAKQLTSDKSWPELRAVVIVLDESEKKVSSSEGMRRSMDTSELLPYRAKEIVPNRIERLCEAFKAHDFEEFARITMADSNQFHAICLDTSPPLKYMSEASWQVVHAVEEFNSRGQIRAGYTFDAGPNACVFLQNEDVVPFLLQLSNYLTLPPTTMEDIENIAHVDIKEKANLCNAKNIVISGVGASPKVISNYD